MIIHPRNFLVFAVLTWSVAAFSQPQDPQQQAKIAATTKTMQVMGTWQGTTPCADCSGILTTLTLYIKEPNDYRDALYRLQMKYIDRGSFTKYGSWTVLRGRPGDPNATVYQLDPDKQGKQYYLRVDDNTLQQLDGDMKPIDSSLNFTLKRIDTSQSKNIGMPNPASVNCTKRGGTLKIETAKDGGQVGICTFPNGKQCEEWALMRNECSPDAK
jgi:putative hemolysin